LLVEFISHPVDSVEQGRAFGKENRLTGFRASED